MAPDTNEPIAGIDVGTMRQLHRDADPDWYARPLGKLARQIDPEPKLPPRLRAATIAGLALIAWGLVGIIRALWMGRL